MLNQFHERNGVDVRLVKMDYPIRLLERFPQGPYTETIIVGIAVNTKVFLSVYADIRGGRR